MTAPRNRSVVVVLADNLSETEAAMTRNGLLMFSGVTRVIPVRGIPDDAQAVKLVARDDLTLALRRAEAERDEAAARLEQVQQIVAGLALRAEDYAS